MLMPNKSSILSESLIYFLLKVLKDLESGKKNLWKLYKTYNYKLVKVLDLLFVFGFIEYEYMEGVLHVFKRN